MALIIRGGFAPKHLGISVHFHLCSTRRYLEIASNEGRLIFFAVNLNEDAGGDTQRLCFPPSIHLRRVRELREVGAISGRRRRSRSSRGSRTCSW